MVSASTKTTAADLLDRTAHKTVNSSAAKNSFSQQLGTALEGHVSRSAAGSRGGIDSSVGSGQNSGGRQILAGSEGEIPTMLGMGPVAGTKPVPYKGAAQIPTMLGIGPVPRTEPVATSALPATVTTVKPPVTVAADTQPGASSSTMTEGDAYWAAQPAAVQVLRGMQDDEAKDRLALQLAGQGYQIDTQIMVWNWDPQMTMQVRANQGYAWVPSFGQSNIPVGPGVSDPFEPVSYNPGNPPPGSIRVSTAFAVGTIQNPLVQIPASNT
jgi:hypothetical protein